MLALRSSKSEAVEVGGVEPPYGISSPNSSTSLVLDEIGTVFAAQLLFLAAAFRKHSLIYDTAESPIKLQRAMPL